MGISTFGQLLNPKKDAMVPSAIGSQTKKTLEVSSGSGEVKLGHEQFASQHLFIPHQSSNLGELLAQYNYAATRTNPK